MLAIDYFLRALVVIAAVGLLVLPGSVSWKLMCLTFFSVGLWCVLFPAGIMGWAKVAHPAVDSSDTSPSRSPQYFLNDTSTLVC